MRPTCVLLWFLSQSAAANVLVYECSQTPTDCGWQVAQIWCDPALWLDHGWFFQRVELCEGYPPPGGQQAAYTRSLSEFLGKPVFFVEFRVQTDANRSELPWGGGAAVSAWSFGNAIYKFEVARDRAELSRGNTVPVIEIDISPDRPHTYRVELYDAGSYLWYVDGSLRDFGVPLAPYPSDTPSISWRAKAAWQASTTQWDYIRYGVIPTDASGDYDSDGDVDADDFYFFEECALGGGVPSGPGCRFADFDADGDTDCDDWAEFAARWTGPPETLPVLSLCAVQPGDLNCDGSVNILDINAFVVALSNPAAYAAAYPTCNPAHGDINADGALDVLDINPFIGLLSR